MKLTNLFESARSPLYHGYNQPDHALEAIKNNEMAATTAQRFWHDGKRRKDNDPEYEKSFWMKGVSLSRDIKFALHWGSIVFVLDQDKLQQNYKIIPFHWGYSNPSGSHHKREREEFVVRKSTWDNYYDSDEDDEEKFFNWNRFKSAEGSIKPLDRYLIGIYVEDCLRDRPSFKPIVDQLTKHPKFIGFYDPKVNK